VSIAGEDIARDVAEVAEQVIMSAKTWMKEDFASQPGPFGRRDNIFRRPWITRLTSDGVVEFEDGSALSDVDVVMFCTGSLLCAPCTVCFQALGSSF
jgi:hypothetical protein